tara:strand:- start:1219 stop:1410 length:192 start_codon:yes stop_codon:yes gene_type:complete
MRTVIVKIEDGLVQNVYSDDEELNFIVVDKEIQEDNQSVLLFARPISEVPIQMREMIEENLVI